MLRPLFFGHASKLAINVATVDVRGLQAEFISIECRQPQMALIFSRDEKAILMK